MSSYSIPKGAQMMVGSAAGRGGAATRHALNISAHLRAHLRAHWATLGLFLVNILIYLSARFFPLGYPFSLAQMLRLEPDAPMLHQYLTFGFSHFNLAHFALNGLLLLLVGHTIERRMGSLPFLAVYMTGATLGSAAYVAASMVFATLPPAAGGSAPLAALMGGLLYHSLVNRSRPLTLRGPFGGKQELFHAEAVGLVVMFAAFNIVAPLVGWPRDFEWPLASIHIGLIGFGAVLTWLAAFFAPLPERLDDPVDTADLVERGGVAHAFSAPAGGKINPLIQEIKAAIDELDAERAWNFFRIYADTTPAPAHAALEVETHWLMCQLFVSQNCKVHAIDALLRLLNRYPHGFCVPRASYELGLIMAESISTRREAIRYLRAALAAPPPECPVALADQMRPLSESARKFAKDTLTALGDPEYVPSVLEGPDRIFTPPAAARPAEDRQTQLAHAFGFSGKRGGGKQPPGDQPPHDGDGGSGALPPWGGDPEGERRPEPEKPVDPAAMDQLFGSGTSVPYGTPTFEEEPKPTKRPSRVEREDDDMPLLDLYSSDSGSGSVSPTATAPNSGPNWAGGGPAAAPPAAQAVPPPAAPPRPKPTGPVDPNASSIFGSLDGTGANLPITFDDEPAARGGRPKSAPAPKSDSTPADAPSSRGSEAAAPDSPPAAGGPSGRAQSASDGPGVWDQFFAPEAKPEDAPKPAQKARPAAAPPAQPAWDNSGAGGGGWVADQNPGFSAPSLGDSAGSARPWDNGPRMDTPPPPSRMSPPPESPAFVPGGFPPAPPAPQLPPVAARAPEAERARAETNESPFHDLPTISLPPSQSASFGTKLPPPPPIPKPRKPAAPGPEDAFEILMNRASDTPAPSMPPVAPVSFNVSGAGDSNPIQVPEAFSAPPASPAPVRSAPVAPLPMQPPSDSTRLGAQRPAGSPPLAAPPGPGVKPGGEEINFAGSTLDQTIIWSKLYQKDRQPLYDPKNKYSVIITPGLEPNTQVIVDVLREFLSMTPQNTLHALKRRHGLLATDLGLNEAQDLTTRFAQNGQSVSLVEQDARIKFGEPRDALRIEFGDGGARVLTEAQALNVRWKSLIALTCGSLQTASGGTRELIDLFFSQPSIHVRIWMTTLMSAPPHFSGRRPDAPREFKELARAIGELAPHAIQSHSHYAWMKGDKVEQPVVFSNLIEYDNYILWYLMAHYARIRHIGAQDPSVTSAPTQF